VAATQVFAAASGDIAVLEMTFAVQDASKTVVEAATVVETTTVVEATVEAELRLVVDLIGDQPTLNVGLIVLMMALAVEATVMLP